MARNKRIEEILTAWWELDQCDPTGKSEARKRLYELLDSIREGTLFSREQVLDHLWGHYTEYKISRRAHEKVQIARSAGQGEKPKG